MFRTTLPTLAQPRHLTHIPKGRLPLLLKNRIKVAEKKEKEYEKAVSKAKAANEPIPPFKKPVVPLNLKPYRILRSASGKWPVYTDYRNNGDCSTQVRKIEVSRDLFLDVESADCRAMLL